MLMNVQETVRKWFSEQVSFEPLTKNGQRLITSAKYRCFSTRYSVCLSLYLLAGLRKKIWINFRKILGGAYRFCDDSKRSMDFIQKYVSTDTFTDAYIYGIIKNFGVSYEVLHIAFNYKQRISYTTNKQQSKIAVNFSVEWCMHLTELTQCTAAESWPISQVLQHTI